MRIDIDRLNDAVEEQLGTAAFTGMPAAFGDLVALNPRDPGSILSAAERLGIDPADFAVDGADEIAGW